MSVGCSWASAIDTFSLNKRWNSTSNLFTTSFCVPGTLNSLQPDATATIFETERHVAAESFLKKMFEIAIEEHYFERRIVFQEGPQHIRFVPSLAMIDPFARIFERIHDIVNMNVHPGLKGREDVKE